MFKEEEDLTAGLLQVEEEEEDQAHRRRCFPSVLPEEETVR